MSRVFRYLLNGFSDAVTIGVPDFSVNNQYQDITNVGNDLRYSFQVNRKSTNARAYTDKNRTLKSKSSKRG